MKKMILGTILTGMMMMPVMANEEVASLSKHISEAQKWANIQKVLPENDKSLLTNLKSILAIGAYLGLTAAQSLSIGLAVNSGIGGVLSGDKGKRIHYTPFYSNEDAVGFGFIIAGLSIPFTVITSLLVLAVIANIDTSKKLKPLIDSDIEFDVPEDMKKYFIGLRKMYKKKGTLWLVRNSGGIILEIRAMVKGYERWQSS